MSTTRGKLALCSQGSLGLITENEPREVTYPDGSKGIAFVGIHMTDKIAPIGSPWSSRNPAIVGEIRFEDIVSGEQYSLNEVLAKHVSVPGFMRGRDTTGEMKRTDSDTRA